MGVELFEPTQQRLRDLIGFPLVDADIATGANINAAKIGTGIISTAEFNQLDGITSAVVGINDTQTLTNKTFDLTDNTLLGTSAELATAISDETGTGFLVFGTNPTIVTPTIASFVNSTHSHLNAAGGGQITEAAISDLQSYWLDATTNTGTNKTLNSFTNDISADKVHVEVRNESGGTINKGDAVFVSGYSVGQDLPLVSLADSSVIGTMPSFGIVESSSIANNANGDVLISGRISGLDTSAFTAGDILYVSNVGTTGNTLTNTKPTGTDLIESVGEVLRSHASLGVLEVELTGVEDLPNVAVHNLSMGGFNLTSVVIVTPTIASFVNATHDHSNAAGGGTIAATDLTGFDAAVAATPSVTANTAKITNATHTGDVTGSVGLTIQSVAITGQATVTAASGDFVLISDTGDSGNLKKVDALDFLGGTSLPVADSTSIVEGSADATKELRFEVDGNTTGIIGVIATIFTTAKTVTIPDATDTLMGKATTDVMTNKSYALGGTGNALTGIKSEFDTALTDDNFAYIAQANIFTANQRVDARVSIQQAIDAGKTLAITIPVDTIDEGLLIQNADGFIQLINKTGTTDEFRPSLFTRSKGSTRNFVLQSEVLAADDVGTTAVIRIDARRDTPGDITTRPILEITNNATELWKIDNDGDIVQTIAVLTANLGYSIENVDGSIKLLNNVATASAFSPRMEMNAAGTNILSQLTVTIPDADDAGTSPVYAIRLQQNDITDIVTRPLFRISNNATNVFEIAANGNIDHQGNKFSNFAGTTIGDLTLVTAVSGDFVMIQDATDGNIKKVNASDFLGGASPPFSDTDSIVEGSADATKELRFEVDGNTTAIIGVIATIFTTAKTITIPDATDTLMGKATADIMTNKTYDADGTGNVLTNIGSSEIKSEIITGLATVTAVSGDFVMISDTGDAGNLKKADINDFLGGGEFTAAWTANHNNGGSAFALEDAKFADPTDDTKTIQLNLAGMTTAIELTISTSQSTAQTLTIPNITAADVLVTENFAQTLASKTLTTPTIASFTNATHDHQAAGGGGTLLSTAALSDTADIAYVNQANTFGAFLNSFVISTMRLPLSATPTMAVDGDFAIDTDLGADFSHGFIKYFDGEEIVVIAVPIAEFTTPPDGGAVTYNATNDEFELVVPAGSGDMVLADVQTVTGAKTFGTIGGAVGKFILAGSTSGSTILNAAAVAGSTTMTLPTTTATLVGIGIANQLTNTELTSGVFAKITGVGAQSQTLDMNNNQITLGTGTLQFIGTTTTITIQSGIMVFDVPTTQSFSLDIAGTPEMTLNATIMNLPNASYQENGVNITPIGLHEQGFDAGNLIPTTTNGASAFTTEEIGGKEIGYIEFANAATNNVTLKLELPNNYNNGTIQIRLYWYAPTSASGNVRWEIKGVALGNSDLLSTAFGTAIPYTDTGVATADDLVVGGLSGAVTLGNTPADNDFIFVNVARLGSDGADTLTDVARLIGGKVQITTDAAVST